MNYQLICRRKTNAGGEAQSNPLPAVEVAEESYCEPPVSNLSPVARAFRRERVGEFFGRIHY